MRLTLPVCVPTNRYWRCWRNRMVLSTEARTYRKVNMAALAPLGLKPLTGSVAVRIVWYRKIKSGDLDGRVKPLLDFLQGIAYVNDSQIVELHASRREDKANPRLEVEILSV